MVVLLKLINNIEVVGEVEAETSDLVILKNPLQINYRYYIGSMPSVSFVKYSMFADSDTASFKRDHIITNHRAREAFVEFYYHSVGDYSSTNNVDNELKNIVEREQAEDNKSEFFKNVLENMSVDDLVKN